MPSPSAVMLSEEYKRSLTELSEMDNDVRHLLCCNCVFYYPLWNVFYVGRRQFPVFTSAMECHTKGSLIELFSALVYLNFMYFCIENM